MPHDAEIISRLRVLPYADRAALLLYTLREAGAGRDVADTLFTMLTCVDIETAALDPRTRNLLAQKMHGIAHRHETLSQLEGVTLH